MADCPDCGFSNRQGVTFCEECGSKYPDPVSSDTLRCGGCGEANPPDYRFCQECGQELAIDSGVVCSGCGHGNSADYAYCEECGRSLGEEAPVGVVSQVEASSEEPVMVLLPPVVQKPTDRTRRWPKYIAAAALVGALAGGGVWLTATQPWLDDDVPQDVAEVGEPPPPPEVAELASSPEGSPPPTVTTIAALSRPTTTLPTTTRPATTTTVVATTTSTTAVAAVGVDDGVADFDEYPTSGVDLGSATSAQDPPSTAFGLTAPPDSDNDGIADWLEEWIVEAFAPIYIFDEHEPSGPTEGAFQSYEGLIPSIISVGGFDVPVPLPSPGNGHPSENMTFAWQVSPVPTPNAVSNNPSVAITIVGLYRNDWVDLGRTTGGSWWHYGDTERMRIFVDLSGPYCNEQQLTADCLTSASYRLVRMTLNRHHETAWYEPHELGYLADSQGRGHLVAFVSEGKHAVYAGYQECEDAPVFGPVKENCAQGHIWRDVDFSPSLNVGEVGYPLIQQLTAVPEFAWVFGTAGDERAWDRNWRFCGGYNVAAGDRERKNGVLSFFGQSSPLCAGPVGNKWFEPHEVEGEWWGSNLLKYVLKPQPDGWYTWEAFNEQGTLVETAWLLADGVTIWATWDGGDTYLQGYITGYDVGGLGVIQWDNGIVFTRLPGDEYYR